MIDKNWFDVLIGICVHPVYISHCSVTEELNLNAQLN